MLNNKNEWSPLVTNSLPVIGLILILAIGIISWQQTYSTYNQNKRAIITEFSDMVNRLALPYKIAKITQKPIKERLPVPVYGVSKEEINDTWNAARSNGRSHEGTDIFAERGTPIFSATEGYVTELNIGDRGGKNVMIIGPGGFLYYYAHLKSIAKGIAPGRYVTNDTVVGFVGNSGNAANTPPHLHFSIYPEMWEAINPYPKLIERWDN